MTELNIIIFKVLVKFNFPTRFINWIKILNTNIYSKININGLLTKNIPIKRSVRQGCPLSMYLYAFAVEPLIYKINLHSNINGIKIPNHEKTIKTFQHADDTSVCIQTESSYHHLHSELVNFENTSESKINNDKCEILKVGTWKNKKINLPQHLIKTQVKLFGIFFGANANSANYLNKINLIKNIIDNWTYLNYNLYEKVIIIKTYIISILHYYMIIIDIPPYYIKQINTLIFKFLWNGIDKLKRNTIYQNTTNGGLSLTDLNTKQKAIHIQKIRKIQENLEQPWVHLYVYWFGLYMRFMSTSLSSNQYVHTLNIPSTLIQFKDTLLSYRSNEHIWHFTCLNI